jgi:ZIP family zinc transporter
MAFSAGLLIGVAFLDLIPEVAAFAHDKGLDLHQLMVVSLCGFVGIFLLEKLTIIHSEKQHDAPGHHHHVGVAGALGLSFHSFLDGVAIGAGFQAGPHTGWIVLLAVVAHDFADGLNTVTFMLATRNSKWRTLSLLALDAIAPVLGALTAGMIAIDHRFIGFQLAFFAGFLLYLGASDLLPSVHQRPSRVLVASTIGGLVTSGVLVFALDKAL